MTKKTITLTQCDSCGCAIDNTLPLGARLQVKTPDDDGMTVHPEKDLCESCWSKLRVAIKQHIGVFP